MTWYEHGKQAHKANGVIVVDSTFAPPPLQNPFKQGADMVMHSGEQHALIHGGDISAHMRDQLIHVCPAATKYFGGHSDLLCGILVVKTIESWRQVCFLNPVYRSTTSLIVNCNLAVVR